MNDNPKQRYSVDEMMDRLKQGGGGEGRGRRRRSHQPHIEMRRRRRRWGVVLVCLLGMLGLVSWGFSTLNRYRVEGEFFRTSVGQSLSSLLGCKVECDRFVSPSMREIRCASIQFQGVGGGVFKSGNAADVSAHLSRSSIFRNEWDAETLRVEKADLTFQAMGAQARPDHDASTALASGAVADGFRLGLSPSPAFISVRSGSIENFAMTWRGFGREWKIDETSLKGSVVNGTVSVQGSGGRLLGAFWPDLPLSSLTATITAAKLKLDALRLRFAENVYLRVSGAIDYKNEGPHVRLNIEVDPVLLSDFLTGPWKERINGKARFTDVTYASTPAGGEEITGKLTVDGALIQGLPFQAALNQRFQSEFYTKLEFRKFSAEFRFSPQRFTLFNMDATRIGVARLTGEVTLHQDDRLEGKLQLAVNTPESNIQGFSGEDGPLDLLDIVLSGTSAAPKDDVAGKLGITPLPAAAPAPQGAQEAEKAPPQ